MSESWPESVPETLWRYGQLQAQDFPQIPMMGITFEPRFLYAFGFGVLFLAVFAWVRFAERKPGRCEPGDKFRRLQIQVGRSREVALGRVAARHFVAAVGDQVAGSDEQRHAAPGLAMRPI